MVVVCRLVLGPAHPPAPPRLPVRRLAVRRLAGCHLPVRRLAVRRQAGCRLIGCRLAVRRLPVRRLAVRRLIGCRLIGCRLAVRRLPVRRLDSRHPAVRRAARPIPAVAQIGDPLTGRRRQATFGAGRLRARLAIGLATVMLGAVNEQIVILSGAVLSGVILNAASRVMDRQDVFRDSRQRLIGHALDGRRRPIRGKAIGSGATRERGRQHRQT